jgi:RNA polymerase sigma factor (sigma-70 family)
LSTLESDKHLLEGLALEDKIAIEKLYRENYKMVQSMIINNNGSSDDAADIFQETMIVLFEKVKTGQFELQCQLKTYMYSVARRLWLKKLQVQHRFNAETDSLADTIPVEDEIEQHVKKNNDFVIMESAMGKIGEPCRSLLQAYYLQKKHMNEIAESFGYTNADNAKTQKYKCLVRLKKLFFAQYKNTD